MRPSGCDGCAPSLVAIIYVEGQVDYQKGNASLFRYEIQNGADPDLKEFAQRTLPKIEDHLQRALKLAKSADIARAASQ